VKRIFSKWPWRRPVLAVIAVMVLSGLALGAVAVFGDRAKPAANCPVLVNTLENGKVAVVEPDSGKTVDINKGEQLLVDLKFTPATGNSWSVREISDPSVLNEVETIYNPNDV
jgi:hypothetical protein